MVSDEDRMMLLTKRKPDASTKLIKGIRLWTGDFSDKNASKMKCPHIGCFPVITPQSQIPSINKIKTEETTPYEDIPVRAERRDNLYSENVSGENDEPTTQPLTATSEGNAARTAEVSEEPGPSHVPVSAATQSVSFEPCTEENTACAMDALEKTERRDDQSQRQSLCKESDEPVMQTQKTASKSSETTFPEMSEELETSHSCRRAPKRLREETAGGSESTYCSDRMLTASKSQNQQSSVIKRRKLMARTTVIEESMEESDTDEDKLNCERKVTTRYSVHGQEAITAVQRKLMRPSTSASSLDDFSPLVATYKVEFSSGEQTLWQNPEFKYTDRKIMFAVAKELGESGALVITHLGVPWSKYQEAVAKHGSCSVNGHLECLIAWCQRDGQNANPIKLKEALAASDRTDLVQVVDNILSGKTGYTTS